MIDNDKTPDSTEPQASTPTGSDTGPSSAPDTPAASDIIVAPDFDWVEMGETPEGTGTIQIDYEIKTGRE